jgi:glycosyltransferase involved in cell wall biosynthesis
MRVCVIVPNVPRLGLGGGGDRIAGLMQQLALRGHRIHLVSVVGKHAGREPSDAAIAGFKDIGVTVHQVPYVSAANENTGFRGLYRMYTDPEAVFAPGERATRPAVTAKVREIGPDCVFCFSPDPLIYVQDLDDVPVLALMSETMSLNMRTQLEYGSPPVRLTDPVGLLRRLKRKLEISARERLDIRHCRKPTLLILSGPHYVTWARRHGIERAALFRTSTPDTGKSVWRGKCEAVTTPAKPRILVIGHLHSTNNASGIPILFEEVIPALKRRLGPAGFDLRIVGAYDRLPAHLRKWLKSRDVTFVGPVAPPDEEFIKSDILLVTVPSKTGPRTRILSAFTFGCCVVAHTNNALGIPELKDGENCLLGRTGEEIAAAVACAAADPALRVQLGMNGRKLYETHYTHQVAGEALEKYLEKTVVSAAGSS